MADTIVTAPDGKEYRFPAGMPDAEIERIMRNLPLQPKEPKGTVGQIADAAKTGSDWLATQTIKTATGQLGMPAALEGIGDTVRSALAPVSREVRGFFGLPTAPAPHLAPAMPPKAGQPGAMPHVRPPSSAQIDAGIFGDLGVPEVDLPGPAGKVVDSGVRAVLGSLPFGPAALLPGFTAGAGSETAGQLTEGTAWEPWARVAGAVVGGGAGAGADALARYAGRAGSSLVEPFTKAGGDKIVGRALNTAASDPATAARTAGASQPTVPGSLPTTAQAANDPGLLALENVLKGRVGDKFAMRAADSNAARMAAADKLAPAVTAEQAGDTLRTAMSLRKTALEGARSSAAGPMYKAADMIDPAIAGRPILDAVNNQLMRSTGEVRDALKAARGALFLGEGKSARLASTPAEWQAVRQALDAQIAGLPAKSPIERVLLDVRGQVDDALKAGPMFKMADTTYRTMSEPLRPYTTEYGPNVAKALETGPYAGPYVQPSEKVGDAFLRRGTTGVDEALAATGGVSTAKQAMAGRLMDDFKAAIRTTADDPLGNKALSAASADRWWQANKDMAAKVMTPDQVKGMEILVADFALGARRPMGIAGSNTAQNLAAGNILNSILRFPALASSGATRTILGRGLDWLYKLPEADLQARLAEAMLDPKVASMLMAKASEGNLKIFGPALERALAPTAVAADQSVVRLPGTKTE